MKYKDELISKQREKVYFNMLNCSQASSELLDFVKKSIQKNASYNVNTNSIERPDGEIIQLNLDDPIIEAARCVQEDLLLLKKDASNTKILFLDLKVGF